MKVALVTRNPVGGIKTYIRYVFFDDVMNDVDVDLIAPEIKSADFSKDSEEAEKISYHSTEETLYRLFLGILGQVYRHRPDIIHSHGFTSALLVVPIAKIFGIHHILTSHDVFLEGQFQGVKGKFKKWLVGRLLGLVDTINPVGKDAAENLLATYPALAKQTEIVPIRNGINSKLFLTEDVRDLRKELGVEDDRILVGFFGRFMAQKGFGILRDAVQAINEKTEKPRIGVVCFGWGGFIREEQEILKERGLECYFHFLPGTDDMAAALRGVDIAAMPSRWEACPLLPMEALVSGTVVVSSNCIGMKEVVADSPALHFKSGDVEDMMRALEEAMENLESHREKAEGFRKIAAERFDALGTAKAVRGLYDDYADKLYATD